MSKIQAVLFPKNMTLNHMMDFLERNRLKPIKDPRETENFIRFRIKNPNQFSKFATKKIVDEYGNIIDLVIGY
jgi:hypothetical protein